MYPRGTLTRSGRSHSECKLPCPTPFPICFCRRMMRPSPTRPSCIQWCRSPSPPHPWLQTNLRYCGSVTRASEPSTSMGINGHNLNMVRQVPRKGASWPRIIRLHQDFEYCVGGRRGQHAVFQRPGRQLRSGVRVGLRTLEAHWATSLLSTLSDLNRHRRGASMGRGTTGRG